MNVIESNELKEIADLLNARPLNYERGALLLKSYHPKNAIYQSLSIHKNESLLREKLLERYTELRTKKYAGTKIEEQNTVESKKQKVKSEKTAENADFPKQVKEVQIKKPVFAQNAETAIKSTKSDDLKHYQKLEADRKQLFKNRGVWHRSMCDVGARKYRLSSAEKQERYQFAKMVDDATTEINRISNLLQFFELNKYFPEEPKQETAPRPSATDLTNEEAKKRLDNSIMPNISKLKKKMKQVQDMLAQNNVPKKEIAKAKTQMAKWQQQLAIFEAEQAEIRAKLKPAE